MLDGMVNDAVEARALSLNPQHIDIYSASWGPEDDGKTVDGPGPLAKKAFSNGIATGRNGLGSIFVWASGNGGRQTDNCNCDGYTNSIYTLSISSATQGGRKPWYLEECSSTLATTYSSGTPSHDASITTVDQDMRLRPNFICTSSHTGTSASAPIAAGIAALALQANPLLTWRDMQHIVIQTANPEPLLHEDGWSTNGVGRKYSHKFGYGLMDAGAIVDVALNWPGTGAQRECKSKLMSPNSNLASRANDNVRVAVSMDACKNSGNQITAVEHVQCRITLKHNPRGSLHLVLISPLGTRSSLLRPRPRDKTDNGFDNWPFLSVHFWGEPPNGTWTLEVTQNEGNTRRPGILKSWELVLYGTADLAPLAIPQDIMDDDLDQGQDQNVDVDILNVLPQSNSDDAILEEKQAENNKVSSSGIESNNNIIKELLDGCHPECLNGCKGPGRPDQCHSCQHYNFSGQCVPACPVGSYATAEKTCGECSKACISCYGPLGNQCLSCGPMNSKLFVSSSSSCVKDCPRGWRPSADGTQCNPCPANCANCNADDECENCQVGLYLRTDSGSCVAVCPNGTFSDKATRTCQPCHPDCDTCLGALDTQCARCKPSRFYFHRNCKEAENSCPRGYFADLAISECAPCPTGCSQCLAPDSCEICDDDWTLQEGKICVPSLNVAKSCPSGKYFSTHHDACQACHTSCDTCFDGTKDGCLTCKDLLHITSCIANECPDSTFQFSKECRHCAHACNKCSSLQKCDTCHTGYSLSSTGHCVPACPGGQYSSSMTGERVVCKICPKSCKECTGQDRCMSCQDGKILTIDGLCVDRCPLGYYIGGDYKDSQRCLPCHGSCHSCSAASPNDCLSCPPGTRLHDNTCESCSLGKYYETSISACTKCDNTCSTCAGPTTSDCLSCSDQGLHLDENKTCVPCCNDSAAGIIVRDLKDQEVDCCYCDAKLANCIIQVEHAANGGHRKRSSIKKAGELANSRYMNAFVIFFIVTLLTLMVSCALRRWKRSRRHHQRAKWRRHNHAYEQIPMKSSGTPLTVDADTGCEDYDNGLDSEDDEDDDEVVHHIFGQERRRLVMPPHNGSSNSNVLT